MRSEIKIKALEATEFNHYIDELAFVLHNCVQNGASISYVLPFSLVDAKQALLDIALEFETCSAKFIFGFYKGRALGMVALKPSTQPNQPHRADVAKLLVRSDARRIGLGRLMMTHLEDHARKNGCPLLCLDTQTGSEAEAFYIKLDWNKAGIIPDFALLPNGEYCDTTLFWKNLSH